MLRRGGGVEEGGEEEHEAVRIRREGEKRGNGEGGELDRRGDEDKGSVRKGWGTRENGGRWRKVK